MFCGLCQSYQMKIALLQEHNKTLDQKIIEIQRINNTLLSTLQNCQSNENWKIKYESLLAEYQELSKLKKIKKYVRQQQSFPQNIPSTQQFIQNANHCNFKPQIFYQTPKSQAQRWSSQKMSNFMSTIKKKKIENKAFTQQTAQNPKAMKNNHCLRTPQKNLFKDKYFNLQEKRGNIPQRRNQINRSKGNVKIHRLDQIFGSKYREETNKNERKTIIEILVFQ